MPCQCMWVQPFMATTEFTQFTSLKYVLFVYLHADCEIMWNCFAEYGKTESIESVEAEESVSVASALRFSLIVGTKHLCQISFYK